MGLAFLDEFVATIEEVRTKAPVVPLPLEKVCRVCDQVLIGNDGTPPEPVSFVPAGKSDYVNVDDRIYSDPTWYGI